MSKKTQKTEQQPRPVETLRDGNIKAAIWRNESEKGAFFSVTFARTYKDDAGAFHDTDSYSGSELLRLAHLAKKAYDRTGKLLRAERAKDETDEEAGA
jgi:hypothetical protein